MKYLIVLLAFVSTTALAETLSWEPPVTREDGTPLDPATEIAEYRLVCGDVVTAIQPTVDKGNQYEVSKHEILSDYGTWDCHMTAVDTDGLESDPSGSVTLEWTQAPPAAPTKLLIITE